MGSIGDLYITVGARIDGMMDAMREVQDALAAVGKSSEEASAKVETGFASMVSAIREHASEFRENCEAMSHAAIDLQIVGAELTEVLTEKLKDLGEESLKAAANTEQLSIVFQALTGSAESAGEMVENLHKFAGNSVLGMASLEQGAQRLLAFGFAGKDVIPILQTLGNVSQAFGKGDAGTGELVDVLGRIRQQGSISSRNLRSLTMFGGTEALAAGMGTSEAEVMERAKAPGGIPATEGISALLTGFQQNFGGIAEKQMNSFNGELQNLKNNIEIAMDEIGQALLPVAKMIASALQEVVGWVKQAAEWFRNLPQPVQDFAFAIAGVIAAIGPFLVAVGGVALAFATIVGSIAGVVFAAGTLGVSFATLIGASAAFIAIGGATAAVLVGITASIAAFGLWVAEHWAGVKAATEQVWDGVVDIWNATLGRALDGVIQKIEDLVGMAKPAWNSFKEAVMDVWQSVTDFVGSKWAWLKDNVVDPMMKWLEAIPGVAKGIAEIAGAGTAFNKAEQDKKEKDQVSKDLSLMAGGASIRIASPQERFKEDHAAKIKEESEALERLKQDYEEGRITLEQLNKAQAQYNALLKEKGPASDAENAAKSKQKVDRNALDALSAAHAHQEALLAMQKASVDHAYQMNQLGTGDKVGMDDSDIAQAEITAGQKRQQALDAIALQERDSTLKELDAKLALYKGDQDGYQKLVGEKTAAEDKYQAELQKNKDAQELIVKKANDQLLAAEQQHQADDLKARAAHNEAVLQLQDALNKAQMKAADQRREYQDEVAQIQLDKGQINANQYLQIQRQALDAAYKEELDDISKERAALEKMRVDLKPDEYNARSQKLDERQQGATNKYNLDVLKNNDAQDKQTYNTVFKPFETSFASSLTGLIEGTKSFSQAWNQMVSSMLNSWISSLAQMAARSAAHYLMDLTMHQANNQAKLASDTTYAGQSYITEFALYLKKQVLKGLEWIFHLGHNARKIASDVATNSISVAQASAAALTKQAILTPINLAIGLSYAGVAAAGAFADNIWMGVPAASAMAAAAYSIGATYASLAAFEHGGLVPGTGLAMLHGGEMVLPKHLSEGVQNMIALSGRMMRDPTVLMQSANGEMPAMSALRNAGSGFQTGDINHNYGGVHLTVHNTAKDPLTSDKVFDMFNDAVRKRNLRMA